MVRRLEDTHKLVMTRLEDICELFVSRLEDEPTGGYNKLVWPKWMIFVNCGEQTAGYLKFCIDKTGGYILTVGDQTNKRIYLYKAACPLVVCPYMYVAFLKVSPPHQNLVVLIIPIKIKS